MTQAKQKKIYRLRNLTSVRTVALFVLAAFLNSTIAWSAPAIPGAQENVSVPSTSDVRIPEEFGVVEEVYQAPDSSGNSPMVIYIQDAHCIYEAQTNIRKIIDKVQKDNDLKLVAVEGGEGKIDPTLFRTFPIQEVKEKVIDRYVQRGELSGADYAAIVNEKESDFYGIEDMGLYDENKTAFLKAIDEKRRVDMKLDDIERFLHKMKEDIYTPELKKLFAKTDDYERERLNLIDYVKYLKSYGPVSAADYPMLNALLQAVEREQSMDPKKVDEEAALLEREIERALKTSDAEGFRDFQDKFTSFRRGEVKRETFIPWLMSKAKDAGVLEESKCPAMSDYLHHVGEMEKIKGEPLFKEIDLLTQSIKEKLFQNDRQRELDRFFHNLKILRNLSKLELSREELAQYREHQEDYSEKKFWDFIGRVPGPLELDELFDPHRGFYEAALKRDAALHQNLMKLLNNQNRKFAMVITGGFHSNGIKEMLKRDGISYMLIVPRITYFSDSTPYWDVMQGKVSYARFMKKETLAPEEAMNQPAFQQGAAAELITNSGKGDQTSVLTQWKISAGAKWAGLIDRMFGAPVAAGSFRDSLQKLIDGIRTAVLGKVDVLENQPDMSVQAASAELKTAFPNMPAEIFDAPKEAGAVTAASMGANVTERIKIEGPYVYGLQLADFEREGIMKEFSLSEKAFTDFVLDLAKKSITSAELNNFKKEINSFERTADPKFSPQSYEIANLFFKRFNFDAVNVPVSAKGWINKTKVFNDEAAKESLRGVVVILERAEFALSRAQKVSTPAAGTKVAVPVSAPAVAAPKLAPALDPQMKEMLDRLNAQTPDQSLERNLKILQSDRFREVFGANAYADGIAKIKILVTPKGDIFSFASLSDLPKNVEQMYQQGQLHSTILSFKVDTGQLYQIGNPSNYNDSKTFPEVGKYLNPLTIRYNQDVGKRNGSRQVNLSAVGSKFTETRKGIDRIGTIDLAGTPVTLRVTAGGKLFVNVGQESREVTGSLIIGRTNFPGLDSTVSREHLSITKTADGAVIQNLSRNGTAVEVFPVRGASLGAQTAAERGVRLSAEDLLMIGSVFQDPKERWALELETAADQLGQPAIKNIKPNAVYNAMVQQVQSWARKARSDTANVGNPDFAPSAIKTYLENKDRLAQALQFLSIMTASPENYAKAKTAVDALIRYQEVFHKDVANDYTDDSTITQSLFERAINYQFKAARAKPSDNMRPEVDLALLTLPVGRANSLKGIEMGNRLKQRMMEEVKKITGSGKYETDLKMQNVEGSSQAYSGTRMMILGLNPDQLNEQVIPAFNRIKQELKEEFKLTDQEVDSLRISGGHTEVGGAGIRDKIKRLQSEGNGREAAEMLERQIEAKLKEVTAKAEVQEKFLNLEGIFVDDVFARPPPGIREALEKAQNKYVPPNNFFSGRLPRPSHDIGRITGHIAIPGKQIEGEGLEYLKQQLQFAANAIISKNPEAARQAVESAQKDFSKTSALLDLLTVKSLKDIRYDRSYKLSVMQKLIGADNNGSLDDLLTRLNRHMSDPNLASEQAQIDQALRTTRKGFYMTKMGDEIGLAYSVDGKMKLADFSELDKFNAMMDLYTADSRDSIYHTILESIHILARQNGVQNGVTAEQNQIFLKQINEAIQNTVVTFDSEIPLLAADGSEIVVMVTRNGKRVATSTIQPGDKAQVRDLVFHYTEKINGARVPLYKDKTTGQVFAVKNYKNLSDANQARLEPFLGPTGSTQTANTAKNLVDAEGKVVNVKEEFEKIGKINGYQKKLPSLRGVVTEADNVMPVYEREEAKVRAAKTALQAAKNGVLLQLAGERINAETAMALTSNTELKFSKNTIDKLKELLAAGRMDTIKRSVQPKLKGDVGSTTNERKFEEFMSALKRLAEIDSLRDQVPPLTYRDVFETERGYITEDVTVDQVREQIRDRVVQAIGGKALLAPPAKAPAETVAPVTPVAPEIEMIIEDARPAQQEASAPAAAVSASARKFASSELKMNKDWPAWISEVSETIKQLMEAKGEMAAPAFIYERGKEKALLEALNNDTASLEARLGRAAKSMEEGQTITIGEMERLELAITLQKSGLTQKIRESMAAPVVAQAVEVKKESSAAITVTSNLGDQLQQSGLSAAQLASLILGGSENFRSNLQPILEKNNSTFDAASLPQSEIDQFVREGSVRINELRAALSGYTQEELQNFSKILAYPGVLYPLAKEKKKALIDLLNKFDVLSPSASEAMLDDEKFAKEDFDRFDLNSSDHNSAIANFAQRTDASDLISQIAGAQAVVGASLGTGVAELEAVGAIGELNLNNLNVASFDQQEASMLDNIAKMRALTQGSEDRKGLMKQIADIAAIPVRGSPYSIGRGYSDESVKQLMEGADEEILGFAKEQGLQLKTNKDGTTYGVGHGLAHLLKHGEEFTDYGGIASVLAGETKDFPKLASLNSRGMKFDIYQLETSDKGEDIFAVSIADPKGNLITTYTVKGGAAIDSGRKALINSMEDILKNGDATYYAPANPKETDKNGIQTRYVELIKGDLFAVYERQGNSLYVRIQRAQDHPEILANIGEKYKASDYKTFSAMKKDVVSQNVNLLDLIPQSQQTPFQKVLKSIYDKAFRDYPIEYGLKQRLKAQTEGYRRFTADKELIRLLKNFNDYLDRMVTEGKITADQQENLLRGAMLNDIGKKDFIALQVQISDNFRSYGANQEPQPNSELVLNAPLYETSDQTVAVPINAFRTNEQGKSTGKARFSVGAGNVLLHDKKPVFFKGIPVMADYVTDQKEAAAFDVDGVSVPLQTKDGRYVRFSVPTNLTQESKKITGVKLGKDTVSRDKLATVDKKMLDRLNALVLEDGSEIKIDRKAMNIKDTGAYLANLPESRTISNNDLGVPQSAIVTDASGKSIYVFSDLPKAAKKIDFNLTTVKGSKLDARLGILDQLAEASGRTENTETRAVVGSQKAFMDMANVFDMPVANRGDRNARDAAYKNALKLSQDFNVPFDVLLNFTIFKMSAGGGFTEKGEEITEIAEENKLKKLGELRDEIIKYHQEKQTAEIARVEPLLSAQEIIVLGFKGAEIGKIRNDLIAAQKAGTVTDKISAENFVRGQLSGAEVRAASLGAVEKEAALKALNENDKGRLGGRLMRENSYFMNRYHSETVEMMALMGLKAVAEDKSIFMMDSDFSDPSYEPKVKEKLAGWGLSAEVIDAVINKFKSGNLDHHGKENLESMLKQFPALGEDAVTLDIVLEKLRMDSGAFKNSLLLVDHVDGDSIFPLVAINNPDLFLGNQTVRDMTVQASNFSEKPEGSKELFEQRLVGDLQQTQKILSSFNALVRPAFDRSIKDENVRSQRLAQALERLPQVIDEIGKGEVSDETRKLYEPEFESLRKQFELLAAKGSEVLERSDRGKVTKINHKHGLTDAQLRYSFNYRGSAVVLNYKDNGDGTMEFNPIGLDKNNANIDLSLLPKVFAQMELEKYGGNLPAEAGKNWGGSAVAFGSPSKSRLNLDQVTKMVDMFVLQETGQLNVGELTPAERETLTDLVNRSVRILEGLKLDGKLQAQLDRFKQTQKQMEAKGASLGAVTVEQLQNAANFGLEVKLDPAVEAQLLDAIEKSQNLEPGVLKRTKEERRGTGYHLTIIPPTESKVMKENAAGVLDAVNNQLLPKLTESGSISIAGIGMRQSEKGDKQTYFLVIDSAKSPSLDEFRKTLGLGEYDLHITLGFVGNDVFPGKKDPKSGFKIVTPELNNSLKDVVPTSVQFGAVELPPREGARGASLGVVNQIMPALKGVTLDQFRQYRAINEKEFNPDEALDIRMQTPWYQIIDRALIENGVSENIPVMEQIEAFFIAQMLADEGIELRNFQDFVDMGLKTYDEKSMQSPTFKPVYDALVINNEKIERILKSQNVDIADTGAMDRIEKAIEARGASLGAVEFSFIPQGDTLKQVIPNTIVVDSGRQNMSDPAVSGAIFDHHQLQTDNPKNAESAASIAFKGKDFILANRDKISRVVAHHNPDLDAITALYVVDELLKEGKLPAGAENFVDYVRLADNAAVDPVSDLENSMPVIFASFLSQISKDLTKEAVDKANESLPDDKKLKGPWMLLADQKTALQEKINQAMVNQGLGFIRGLLNNGFDIKKTGGRLSESDVPAELLPSFKKARDGVLKDIRDYVGDKSSGVLIQGVKIPNLNDKGATPVNFLMSRNTKSSGFFEYLYTDGISGGVIYKDTQDETARGSTPAEKVVIAVNTNQNLNLNELAKALDLKEREKRAQNPSLPQQPQGTETAFFKAVSNGTLIISTGRDTKNGNVVLTAEEVTEVIQTFAQALPVTARGASMGASNNIKLALVFTLGIMLPGHLPQEAFDRRGVQRIAVSSPEAGAEAIFDAGRITDRTRWSEAEFRELISDWGQAGEILAARYPNLQAFQNGRRMTDPERQALQDAIDLAVSVDSSRARELFSGTRFILVDEVPDWIQATANYRAGAILINSRHLAQLEGLSRDQLVRGWVLSLMHEMRHNLNRQDPAFMAAEEDFRKKLGVAEGQYDYRLQAMDEESAYKETADWMEKLGGFSPQEIAIQRYLADHIRDESYSGLAARFVTGQPNPATGEQYTIQDVLPQELMPGVRQFSARDAMTQILRDRGINIEIDIGKIETVQPDEMRSYGMEGTGFKYPVAVQGQDPFTLVIDTAGNFSIVGRSLGAVQETVSIGKLGTTFNSAQVIEMIKAGNPLGAELFIRASDGMKGTVLSQLDPEEQKYLQRFQWIQSIPKKRDVGKPLSERLQRETLRRSEREIFEIGNRLRTTLSAQGVSAERTGAAGMGIDNLLNIILEGNLRSKWSGPLVDESVDTTAGHHGPFYVIQNPAESDLQSRAGHKHYLVPEAADADFLKEGISKARDQGLIDRKTARDSIDKIMTYDQFIQRFMFKETAFPTPATVRGASLGTQAPVDQRKAYFDAVRAKVNEYFDKLSTSEKLNEVSEQIAALPEINPDSVLPILQSVGIPVQNLQDFVTDLNAIRANQTQGVTALAPAIATTGSAALDLDTELLAAANNQMDGFKEARQAAIEDIFGPEVDAGLTAIRAEAEKSGTKTGSAINQYDAKTFEFRAQNLPGLLEEIKSVGPNGKVVIHLKAEELPAVNEILKALSKLNGNQSEVMNKVKKIEHPEIRPEEIADFARKAARLGSGFIFVSPDQASSMQTAKIGNKLSADVVSLEKIKEASEFFNDFVDVMKVIPPGKEGDKLRGQLASQFADLGIQMEKGYFTVNLNTLIKNITAAFKAQMKAKVAA